MDKNNQEKLKALDVALTQIEKAYGKGAVMKLDQNQVVRQLLLFMQLQRFRKEAALQALLMLSMHLILFMQEILVLILIISTYLSRIMENRHLKSLRRWFAQVLLIL